MMKILFLLSLFIMIVNASVIAKNKNCEWVHSGDSLVTRAMIGECKSEIANLSINELSKLISWVIVSSDIDVVNTIVYSDLERALTANRIAPVEFIFLTLNSPNEALKAFQLFESIGVDVVNSRLGGKSIAYYAIETGNKKIFEYLASAQKYSKLVNEDRNLLAAITAGDIKTLRTLLKAGLNTKITDKSGCNMLDYAIAHNELEIEKYLTNDIETDKPRCQPNKKP